MTRVFRFLSAIHFGVALVCLYLLSGGPYSALPLQTGGILYSGTLLWSFFLGLRFLFARRELGAFHRRRAGRLLRSGEVFLAVVLVLGMFDYIFALNANMDYVQRFIASGGRLSLAIDTETERTLVAIRYVPLLVAGLLTYLSVRLLRPTAADRASTAARRPARPEFGVPNGANRTAGGILGPILRVWGFPLVLSSSVLHALSFPSFANIDGFAWLGWFALVPLFLVLRYNTYRRGVFYLVIFGTVTMIVSNYWLGTFSLVSLQLTIVFFALYYALFGTIVLLPFHRLGRFGFFYLGLAWVGFEYLRSIGFLGYPWVLVGHSQYAVGPLIQLASVTGVWGISLLVLLANAALAAAIAPVQGERENSDPARGFRRLLPVLVALGGIAIVAVVGIFATQDGVGSAGEEETARIALIQQNSDPRKHIYEETFETLKNLTNASLESDPDIVAWSETAFVPNIRRWSQEDPGRYRLSRLVLRFLEYQRSIDTWLVTGNDDYRLVLSDEGEEIDRLNFNAAVLFSSSGDRVETYHKVKLVPFTEYFPYRRQLPWVYDLLQAFDVHFWEPGTVGIVFHHPKFRFVTPICFEDVFPNHIRRFVRDDVDVILALTNDYWSLSPVQAKQHFVASLFRTVENRRPMVRATASGLTGHVDAYGRIRETLPYYEEGHLVVDVRVGHDEITLYSRLGDWLPLLLIGFVALFGLVVATRR